MPERAGAKELLQPVLRTHRPGKIWADGGFSGPEFSNWVSCQRSSTKVEIVKRISENAGFHVLPKRRVVKRTFAWIVQHRRLVRDYERSPECAAAWGYLR